MTPLITQIRPCPVCGSDAYQHCFDRKDLTHLTTDTTFNVVRCNQCGMGYVRNIPIPGEMEKIYPKEFYASNSSNYINNRPLRNKLAMLPVQKGKLLDIGCANGEFVVYAAERGWDAYGFDWTTKIAPTPRTFYGGHLSDHFSQKHSFDAITLWAVLEHIPSAHEIMREVTSFLKPGGTFITLVTNFNSIAGRYMRQDDVPRHVNLFTKRSLAMLLKQYEYIPVQWNFGNTIFNSSHRGLLVFLLKRLLGESMDDIVAQHRMPGTRHLFCNTLHGKPSKLISTVTMLDRNIAPALDKVLEWIQCGHLMTVVARKQ